MLVRLFRVVLYGVIGAVIAGICAWMFMSIWTAVFMRVPLPHVWQYIQQNPPYAVFATAVVMVGVLVGLAIGVAKGLRSR